MSETDIELVVIGAGIVGLAVARAWVRRFPGAGVHLIDKEEGPAFHQTGRNSGVIHSGIYYRPGSLKARATALGRAALVGRPVAVVVFAVTHLCGPGVGVCVQVITVVAIRYVIGQDFCWGIAIVDGVSRPISIAVRI